MTSPDAQLDEANRALQNGDRGRVLYLLLPLAEAGNARAQYGLGLLYSVGDKDEFDKNLAIYWHEKALANGDPRAAFALGELFHPERQRPWEHFNVPPFDAAKSDAFFARAAAELPLRAKQGDMAAINMLGEIYLWGFGVDANPAIAAEWYRLAFENGVCGASNTLWSLYSGGYYPGIRDDKEAVFWYRKMREHQCQCLADARWEAEMVEKGLLAVSELSPTSDSARFLPRFTFSNDLPAT